MASAGKPIVNARPGDNTVLALQDRLRSAYGSTGGDGTDSAVRDSQSRRGLTADGVVGLNARHALVG